MTIDAEEADFVYVDPAADRFKACVYGLTYSGGRYCPKVTGKDANSCHDDESEDPEYTWDLVKVFVHGIDEPICYPWGSSRWMPVLFGDDLDTAIIQKWWDEKRYLPEPPCCGE